MSEQLEQDEKLNGFLVRAPKPIAFFSKKGGWLRWLCAIMIVCIIHTPLYWLKKPVESSEPEQKRISHPITLLPPSSELMSDDLQDLYNWLSVYSPTNGARPDFALGFSHYAYPSHQVTPVNVQPFTPTPFILPPLQNPPASFQPTMLPTVASLVHSTWFFSGLPHIFTVSPRHPAPGWYWHFNGSSAASADITPPLSKEGMALLQTEIIPLPPSEFDLIFSPQSTLPRLVLRQSCGNSALDAIAANSIRAWLLPAQNVAFPTNQTVHISIDWRLP